MSLISIKIYTYTLSKNKKKFLITKEKIIMAVSQNTINLISFLKEHNDENLTADMVADAMGLSVKTVNGAFTAGIQRKGLGVRVEDEVLDEETGKHKICKYLKLTEEGFSYDPSNIED